MSIYTYIYNSTIVHTYSTCTCIFNRNFAASFRLINMIRTRAMTGITNSGVQKMLDKILHKLQSWWSQGFAVRFRCSSRNQMFDPWPASSDHKLGRWIDPCRDARSFVNWKTYRRRIWRVELWRYGRDKLQKERWNCSFWTTQCFFLK